jgi:hypothetical protein
VIICWRGTEAPPHDSVRSVPMRNRFPIDARLLSWAEWQHVETVHSNSGGGGRQSRIVWCCARSVSSNLRERQSGLAWCRGRGSALADGSAYGQKTTCHMLERGWR